MIKKFNEMNESIRDKMVGFGANDLSRKFPTRKKEMTKLLDFQSIVPTFLNTKFDFQTVIAANNREMLDARIQVESNIVGHLVYDVRYKKNIYQIRRRGVTNIMSYSELHKPFETNDVNEIISIIIKELKLEGEDQLINLNKEQKKINDKITKIENFIKTVK